MAPDFMELVKQILEELAKRKKAGDHIVKYIRSVFWNGDKGNLSVFLNEEDSFNYFPDVDKTVEQICDDIISLTADKMGLL